MAPGTTWCGLPNGTTRQCGCAPMSGRCSFPEDHPLFAGFLPPMREKIVSLLAGHDVDLRARRCRVHLPRRRRRAASSGRRSPRATDRRSAHRRLDAAGHVRGGKHSPRRAGSARARPAAAASAPGPSPRARAARRAFVADVRGLRHADACRDPRSRVDRRRRGAELAAGDASAICRSCAAKRSTRWTAAGSATRCRRRWAIALGKPGAKVIGLDRRRIEHVLDPGACGAPRSSRCRSRSSFSRTGAMPRCATSRRRSASLRTSRSPGTELPGIDFVALARGQGCGGVNVNARGTVA